MEAGEQRQRQLRRLLWANTARQRRPEAAARLAGALGCQPEAIRFADGEPTELANRLLAEGVRGHPESEWPDRAAAEQQLRTFFAGVERPVALLHQDFDHCGVVEVPLAQILGHLDALLKSEAECLRFVSWDGAVGACVVVQEGTSPHHPRYANVWK